MKFRVVVENENNGTRRYPIVTADDMESASKKARERYPVPNWRIVAVEEVPEYEEVCDVRDLV